MHVESKPAKPLERRTAGALHEEGQAVSALGRRDDRSEGRASCAVELGPTRLGGHVPMAVAATSTVEQYLVGRGYDLELPRVDTEEGEDVEEVGRPRLRRAAGLADHLAVEVFGASVKAGCPGALV